MLPLAYEPRAAEDTVLHAVVRDHLEEFLATTAGADGSGGVPRFVARELRDFLGCGVLGRGFARVRCGTCAFERLVPFSCKARAVCSSCGGRRMTAQAAHLVDAVLPRVPVRQWVLTLPYRLRWRLAFDHGLCRAVLGMFVRALLTALRRRARRLGTRDGLGGAVTVVQRFSGGLGLNVHFHTLAVDGVFAAAADGTLRFQPLPAPTPAEVARLLAGVQRRVQRLLTRRGLGEAEAEAGGDDGAPADALAQLGAAAVQGRLAFGPQAGARVPGMGGEPPDPVVPGTTTPRAHCDGFDLHAAVAVPAGDRERLEKLCRYVLRPPIAQERLGLQLDGRIVLTLKAAWRDGTTHLVFTPLELLGRLAVLIPRPRVNLVLYHGILAPHARGRAAAVAFGAPAAAAPAGPDAAVPGPAAGGAGEAGAPATIPGAAPERAEVAKVGDGQPPAREDGPRSDPRADPEAPPPAPPVPGPAAANRAARWADLMRRAFALDVLACPRCGGRMTVIATIDDPRVVRKILDHLGLPTTVPMPRPPPRDAVAFAE